MTKILLYVDSAHTAGHTMINICEELTKRRIGFRHYTREILAFGNDWSVKCIHSLDQIFKDGLLFNKVYVYPSLTIPDELRRRSTENIKPFLNIYEVCDVICDIELTNAYRTPTHIEPSLSVKDVIFNPPATIVFWTDGTKTVVKCQDDDIFDPEKGLAMAISKKALGNKGNYCNELKKWLPKEEEDEYEFPLCKELTEVMNKWPSLIDRLRSKLGIIALKKGYNPVQKAYDLAVEIRDEAKDDNKSLNHYDIDAIIGYLGEALED